MQNVNDQELGDGEDEPQPTTGYHNEPDTAVPPTVLLTELESGALLLQGTPYGPRRRLSPADAVPIKRELAAAFGSAELTQRNNDQDETR